MKKKYTCPIQIDINIKHLILIINTICSFIIFEYRNVLNIYTVEISNVISLFISLICFVLAKKSTLKEENQLNKNIAIKNIQYSKIYQMNSRSESIKDFFLVFFILLIIQATDFIIYYNKKRVLLIFQSFSIYAMIIFEHFFLKGKIYIHHFFSVISLFIFSTIHPKFKKNVIYGDNKGSSLIYYFTEGLLLFVIKYFMDNLFVSPYLVSFNKSFLLFLSSILKLILQTYYFKEEYKNYFFDDNYFQLYNKEYFKQVLMFLSNIIFPIFSNLLIYYFSPYYYLISIEIGGLFNIKTIPYIIHLIGCSISIMIFCEIIIINLCGMSYNTRKKIKERSQLNYNEDKSVYCEFESSQQRISSESYDFLFDN